MNRLIRKAPCKHCPAAHCPPDEEMQDLKLFIRQRLIDPEQVMYRCGWDYEKLCRGAANYFEYKSAEGR